MIEVIAGFVVRDGRALLCQRPADKDYPFTWECPGGKVTDDESYHGTVRRELCEELGIVVGGLSEDALWCGEVKRKGRDPIWMAFYFVGLFVGTPTSREGQGLGWFNATELRRLELAPGSRAALGSLLQCLRRHG